MGQELTIDNCDKKYLRWVALMSLRLDFVRTGVLCENPITPKGMRYMPRWFWKIVDYFYRRNSDKYVDYMILWLQTVEKMSKINKCIDLSALPRFGNSDRVSWKDSVGYKINFIYYKSRN